MPMLYNAAQGSIQIVLGSVLASEQSMEDVEDTQEGATMHFLELSDLVERVRANVDAIHVCKAYYMAYCYKEVRSAG